MKQFATIRNWKTSTAPIVTAIVLGIGNILSERLGLEGEALENFNTWVVMTGTVITGLLTRDNGNGSDQKTTD